ncbi:hypothetical protein FOBRF1_006881 [Fusarium oxysporum]
MGSQPLTQLGFIGLGAMGLGMASDLITHNKYAVKGYDIYPPSVKKLVSRGGSPGTSPRDVAQGSSFLICMAATAQQVDTILFESASGALEGLPRNATLILCSTVPPGYFDSLASRIDQLGRSDVHIVDAPVSGGTFRAANGTLTIFAAGSVEALTRADEVLRDMSEKLYIIPGALGAGSKVKMVNQLLVGTQIAAAAEAFGLASKAGLDGQEIYEIIRHTAGSSWVWDNRVPRMLNQDWKPLSALNIFVKDMGIVMSTGRDARFPLPLSSVAEQLYISGSSQGYGLEDDAGLVRLFLQELTNYKPLAKPTGEVTPEESLSPLPEGSLVAFIGVDSNTRKMASCLLRDGMTVRCFDRNSGPLLDWVATKSGSKLSIAGSPSDVAKDADVVLLSLGDGDDIEQILFKSGLANSLNDGATIILASPVSPSFAKYLQNQLSEFNRGFGLVDAPMSRGSVQGGRSELIMFWSGEPSALSGNSSVLRSLSGAVDHVFPVSGGVGAASTVKLVDQLLAAVHLATTTEALKFARHLGLEPKQLHSLLINAAAWSWVFEKRGLQVLGAEDLLSLDLVPFIKDLEVVLLEAKKMMFWVPVASTAYTSILAEASSVSKKS